MAENKIITGYGNGYFGATDPIIREHLAAFLYRYLKPQGNFDFTDMKGHWANEYVKILAGNKITHGTGDGNFNPNGLVTREQFSVFLYRTIMATSGIKNNESVGWVVDGEKKYYYDKLGVKHTGLLRSGDDTYLFDKNGNLASGWNTVDGKDYYFDTVSGAAQKGWFSQTGIMQTITV
ncbi:S-layer homology domain-containing protein [Bacillus cereus]|uniref:S-layer homology domain-containing protein n=1 Tax=Bacillus cereus TaxID=1396 RepID=UPI0020D26AB5|nr:S-layer homology domain-containing protein [Bacillus cereus]